MKYLKETLEMEMMEMKIKALQKEIADLKLKHSRSCLRIM